LLWAGMWACYVFVTYTKLHHLQRSARG
jgi:hypothetical protein